MTVNIRLCKPALPGNVQVINGMEEFFAPEHYVQGPVAIMICSPWIDGDPLKKLVFLKNVTSALSRAVHS